MLFSRRGAAIAVEMKALGREAFGVFGWLAEHRGARRAKTPKKPEAKPDELKWKARCWPLWMVIVGPAAPIIFLAVKLNSKRLIEDNRKLEKTIEERTSTISHQKEEIEHKQKEILDSINYAQRIQRALLASEKLLDKNLPEYFV